MEELLGSKVKAEILVYLGLRGGASGRQLARILKKSPTPVFKALTQLVDAGVLIKNEYPSFYNLNPYYPYYEELVSIIRKTSTRKDFFCHRYSPKVDVDKRIDPFAVYEISRLRPLRDSTKIEKFSDILRKRYD